MRSIGVAPELSLWAVSMGVTSLLIDVEPYERCRVAGVVERLVLDPSAGSIEATISDGIATMRARWPFHRACLELSLAPGRRVVLDGFSAVGPDGCVFLDQPSFQIAWDRPA